MGIIFNSTLTWDNEIGKLCSNLHNRIYNINKLKDITNFNTRLNFLNAYVIGKMRYMLPVYMGTSNDNITKLHKVIMRAARTARGNYCCRQNITSILSSCKWMPIAKMITHSAIVTIHTILIKQTPQSLIQLFNNIALTRTTKNLSLKYTPRTTKFQKFYLFSGLKIYNNLPPIMKLKSIPIFKKLSKKWLINGVNDSND